MHKLSLITYLIMSRNSRERGSKVCLGILIGNGYVNPSFDISLEDFVPILPSIRATSFIIKDQIFRQVISGNCGDKMPTINIFGHF